MQNDKLSPEDQERVNKYLSSPIHSVERKPFRPFLLLFWVLVTMSGLTLLSIWLSRVFLP